MEEQHYQQEESSDSRYLAKLEFRSELKKTWLNFFVSNVRVVALLIVLLTAWGGYSYAKLPKESNPEVKIPIAVVSTMYPGAGPSDIEELVTKKIETAVAGLKGIHKVTSNSSNSISSITVEFDANEDLDDAIRRLRDKVNTVKKDLPQDAKEPIVTEISLDDQPIWTIALTGPQDGFALRGYADTIKDELEKIPGVREVRISGGDEREFEVAYDPQKLQSYGITLDAANGAIAATNRAIPGGNFDGSKFVYPVRTDARFYNDIELANIPVGHADNGTIVSLKDVATVRERAIKKTAYSRFSIKGSAPQSSVSISVVKRTGGSVVDITARAKTETDRLVKTFPTGVAYDITHDMGKQINKDFEQLTHDFLLTLVLVMGILLLIVGLKEAFVAGLAIPLVFFATFGVMLATGLTLNFLSVFSLLLALGLLVDDAIVVVSATKQYLKTGKFTPEEAVLLVLNDFKVVLTTTTLTTVWAFAPLLFSTGIMGQYLKSIPITVSVTLIASLFVALMINHPLAAVLERIRMTKRFFFLIEGGLLLLLGICIYAGGVGGYVAAAVTAFVLGWMVVWYGKGGDTRLIANKTLADREWSDDDLIKTKLREQGSHADADLAERLIHGIVKFDKVIPIYERYLRSALQTAQNRRKVIAGTFAIFVFSVALPLVGIVKTEFFPASDYETMFVNVEAPIGLKLDETDQIVRKVEERLMTHPEIANFSVIVGGSVSQNGSSGGNSSHVAGITITLVDKAKRSMTSYEFATKLRSEFADMTNAKVMVETVSGGPPSGAAFEARIKGDDLGELDRVANDLKKVLSDIPGVVNPEISLKEAVPEFTFVLDPVKLEQENLNASYVGSVLRTAISGTKVTTVIRESKEIDVVARFDEKAIPTLESLQNLQIINPRGRAVFLKDVAKIELKPSINTITRIDQKRTAVLSAGVAGTVRPNEVVAEFQKRIKKDHPLPQGYEIVYGGENEQNAESVQSIIMAMGIAIILIIATLIIQFNSFKKTLIVLVTLPLALIGVFLGMALTGIPLSFPGLIGILALFGIVVKNAIILIDKMNLNIKFGIPFEEAVIDAGKSRLEAIFITSVATISGIIPITLSNETWKALGTAMIFGLALSSFLTLFIIPVLFVMLVRPDEKP